MPRAQHRLTDDRHHADHDPARSEALPAFPFDATPLPPSKLVRFAYCAFGSNLHRPQMAYRCPGAELVTTGELQDFRLVFRRSADVVFHPGHRVPVALFRVTRSCVESLDRFEGFPRVYERRFVLVHTREVGPVWSFVYVMKQRPIEPPSREYLNTIEAGYKHLGFSLAPLRAAARASYPRPVSIASNKKA